MFMVVTCMWVEEFVFITLYGWRHI